MTQSLPGQQLLPGMAAPPAQRETVMNLLRDFARQDGCEKYKSDSDRIRLLSTYLWLRQLTENLSFETFLTKFAAIGDFDETNRKHPDDAMAFHCPRARAHAEKAGKDQWAAKDCVGIMALYVDMVREAERQNIPVPMTLDQYLEMDAPAVKSGEVQLPKADPLRGGGGKAEGNGQAAQAAQPAGEAAGKAAPKARRAPRQNEPSPADADTGLAPTGVSLLPTQAGQRVIYRMPSSDRQRRGSVKAITVDGDRQYVDFETDEGELFEGCNIQHFTVLDEPLPATREDILGKAVLWIPKAQFAGVQAQLGLQGPIGGVPVGDLITQFRHPFTEQGLVVDVDIMNGETGPYVDARLINGTTGDVLLEEPPRQRILGTYRFPTTSGVIVLEVKTRE